MRSPLLFIPALVLLATAPAGAQPAETAFSVRPGHPMRVVAINQSGAGNSNSTSWVIVRVDGNLAAVDVQPSVRAEASAIVTRPGRHRASAICDNHIATIVSCTIRAVPAP